MRKILIPASLALLAGMTIANAAEVTGTIKAIDVSKTAIKLDNGKTYVVSSKTVDVSALKVGEKVRVTFRVVGKKNEASAIVGM